MDVKAFELLKVFQTNDGAIDTKLRYLNDIKSDIKHKSVPETAIPNIFEAIRRSIASSHSQQLMVLAFSTLTNFLKRLHGQGQANVIGFHGHKLFYPLLVEKLSDHRDNVRHAASRACSDFWIYALPEARFEIEHNIIQNVLSGKNPRPKVLSLQWLSDMVKDQGLKFRSYVPLLITCLEDADGAVRDAAKSTVIQLFKGASGRAIGDLTKQIRLRNVRKTISDTILAEVSRSPQSQNDMNSSIIAESPATRKIDISLPARPHTRAELQRPTSSMSSRHISRADTTMGPVHTGDVDGLHVPKRTNRPNHHSHTQSDSVEADASSVNASSIFTSSTHSEIPHPRVKTNDSAIEPLYIDSGRPLDEHIMSTRVHFEGRETEHNWTKREESIMLLRRITKGNAPSDFSASYISHMNSMVEGILKTVNSLRTTLSTVGCELIQEMCKAIGHGIDSMVEILLQDLIKLCAGTKKISANNGNATVDAIVASATINHRVVNHIWQACQDKNVQPRTFASGWLKTLMRAHRQACSRTGCLELIEKSIRKGLEDANPGVRTNMRSTYWMFAGFWPEKAQGIMSSLDAKSQNLLQLDPSNPSQNVDGFSKSTSSRPESAASRRPKQSIKEAIANQKKLKHQTVADELPSRPASAMSAIMDNRPPKSVVRPHPVPASTTANITSGHSLTQSASSGSLLSAPMRPPMRPGVSRKPDHTRHDGADFRSKPTELESVAITSTVPHLISHAERPTLRSSATSPEKTGSKPVLSGKPSMMSSASSPEKQQPKVSAAKNPPTSPPKARRTAPTPVGSPARPRVDHKKSTSVASIGKGSQRKVENEPPTPPTKRASLIPQAQVDSPSVRTLPDEDTKLATPRKERRVSRESFGSRASISSIPRNSKSHSQQNSDDLGQGVGPIKVYEDPFSPGESPAGIEADQTVGRTTAVPPTNVLEDLPVNPRNDFAKSPVNMLANSATITESPLQGQGHSDPGDIKLASRRWQKSELARPQPVRPKSKDRGHNQEKLRKYVEGIRNKNIDVMGFRKLQGIIFDHDEIFEDETLFDDMVLALLGLLETPHQGTRQFLGRSHDQKESALSTLKLIMDKQPKYIKAYYARTLAALIVGRQFFENASHIVSGFESLSNRVLRDCSPSEAMDAVLDTLIIQENNEATDRSMIMGTSILSGLLWKAEQGVIATYEDRLTEVARNGFQRGRPAIRRSMVQFAKTLSAFIKPETRFFSMVAGGDPDLKSLLTYYMNVRG